MYFPAVTEFQGWDSHKGGRRRECMFGEIGAGEIILILAVLLLLFGAKKLPELARSIGKSARALKDGLKEGMEDEDDDQDKPAS